MAYTLRLRRKKPARYVPPKPLPEMKKAELVELAEAEGVDASGTRAEIIERLSDE